MTNGLFDNRTRMARELWNEGQVWGVTLNLLLSRPHPDDPPIPPEWAKPWGHYPDVPDDRRPDRTE